MPKKVSITDLALAAGVSKTLVSMVLNGKARENGISSETEARVIEIARKMQYQPNAFARGLRIGKSNTIGLILPDISNTFYAGLARSVEDIARKNKYSVIMCSSDESKESEMNLLRLMSDKQADGIILASTLDSDKPIIDALGEDYPLILVDREWENTCFPVVKVDNYNATRQATEYLIAKGHKKISMMTIGPSHLSTQVDRINGYIAGLEARKIPVLKNYIVEIPHYDVERCICTSVFAWRSTNTMPTAIIAANNFIAKGCLDCIINNKLSIPEEVSLISFDDIELFHYSNPSVTAISQPIRMIGEKAFEELFRKFRNPAYKMENRLLPTEFIARNSVSNIE
jgi:LacI family transcriptional regulator